MLAALQLGRLRQEVVKVAAPPRRVFPFAEALVLGRVQNLLDPAPQLRDAVSALACQIGFRTARTSSVVTVSTGLDDNGAA